MPWLRRSVAVIGRAMVKAVSRRHWPCHGSDDQSPALAVPCLRLSVAGIGRAVIQAVSRRHWSCHGSGGQSPGLAVPKLRALAHTPAKLEPGPTPAPDVV